MKKCGSRKQKLRTSNSGLINIVSYGLIVVVLFFNSSKMYSVNTIWERLVDTRCTVYLLLILFGVLGCLPLFAQNIQYRKYQYPWKTQTPAPLKADERFLNEDAVILNEENIIEASGTKAKFLKIYQEKKLRIKYLTQAGIDKFSRISIPESFDPLFDYKDVPSDNPRNLHRPKIFDVKIIYFAARIINSKGQVEKAEFKDFIKEEKKLYNLIYQKIHSYEFRITNLAVGDELEIAYRIEIPYRPDNWYMHYSARIFFHGNYPKQNYSFVLKTNEKLKTLLTFQNGCKPDSVVTNRKKITYFIHYSNLPGCMDEKGSKPSRELPHIVYDINPAGDKFFYQDPYKLENAVLPYWLYVLKLRESYLKRIKDRTDPIVKDKQTGKVEKFILETIKDIPADQPLNRMLKIHQTIVDSFDYHKDDAYFAGIDTRLERLGDFTENKIMREISKFKLYAKAFNLIELPFSTVYFMDKRIADMNSSYISPIVDNEYAFIVKKDEKPLYIYPKRSRFGYMTDELPFYWENSPALYVEFHNLWSDKIADLNFINTPSSAENDNVRVSTVKASVNTANGSIDFDARITLSGQFSTMTRGLYKYDYKDSSINPLYHKKIWDIGENTKLLKSSVINQIKQYPFKTDLSASYRSENTVAQIQAGVFSMSLKGWFNHIISDDLSTKNRVLRYYLDFLFQDSYKYYFQFDKNVEILNAEDFNVEIENNLGKLKIEIKTLQPNAILLESYFLVNNGVIPAENIADVETIYNAIKELNNRKLEFKIKE